MTQQKTSTKRQSIVIAILAVLLVGLLAFNITYAFFTDKKNTVDEFTFGTISLKAIEGSVADPIISIASEERSKSNIMPGDKISGSFKLDLEDGSEDAFIRFKIEADPEFSYFYEEGTVISTAGAEGNIVAIIDGELVSANIGEGGNTVTVYDAQGQGTEAATALANKIKAFRTFTKYTVTENISGTDKAVTYEVIYSKEDNEPVVAKIKRTVAGEESTYITGADANAMIEKLYNDYQRKLTIDDAIADINNAMQAANGDLATDMPGFSFAGDGYVYKDTALAEDDEAITAAISYLLPYTLGNELQGVKVNFKVVVEAVQAANVSTADFEDANSAAAEAFDALDLDENDDDCYDAVRMFYIATEAHSEILENLD